MNSEPLLLAHFGVPLAGGTLVSINTRLTSAEIGYILEQSGSTKVFYSPELRDQIPDTLSGVPLLNVEDEFEDLLSQGGDAALPTSGFHEDETLAINYTSGTTGRPKGVMYHHRGAYLNALAMVLDQRLTADSVYLWTLPRFQCNGWTFAWGLAAVGAKSVCIPRIDPTDVWRRFDEGVTHFCAAPTVLTMLVNDPAAHRLERPVRLFTAGAPPSPTIISQMAALNFELEHTYGLTETYGPSTYCAWQEDWDDLDLDGKAEMMARQGVGVPTLFEQSIMDPDTMMPVPADGEAIGELMIRSNTVMKGYLKNPKATQEAFEGGWFHSGDLGVWHPDGYVELKDRSKDIIISGGENISSIEVEDTLYTNSKIAAVAVVATPSEKWGETPTAFIELKPGEEATPEEIIEFCRNKMAHYKCPRRVVFDDLPKTSTGKVQKFVLRERARALG